MIPFDVVLHTRSCDDASPDREYKRRKIDTNGKMERRSTSCASLLTFSFHVTECHENTQSRPGSSHDALARPIRPSIRARITTTPSPCPCPPTPPSASTRRYTSPTRPRAARPSMTSAITGSRFPSRTHTRMKDATTGTRTGTTSRRRSSSHTRTRPSHQWECA
jgi:hypothetical protein